LLGAGRGAPGFSVGTNLRPAHRVWLPAATAPLEDIVGTANHCPTTTAPAPGNRF